MNHRLYFNILGHVGVRLTFQGQTEKSTKLRVMLIVIITAIGNVVGKVKIVQVFMT